MKDTHKQSQEERYQIYEIRHEEKAITNKELAERLGRSASTIGRELRRNKGKKGYRPKQAHKKAKRRRAVNARRVQAETRRKEASCTDS